MSTRSIIVVIGKNHYGQKSVTRLYKHSDGYPTGTLDVIRDALKDSIKAVLDDNNNYAMAGKRAPFKSIKEVQEYEAPKGSYQHVSRLTTGLTVGKLIGHGTTVYGMGIQLEKEYSAEFDPAKHLGNQGDLEWIYIVDLESLSCNVFGGGYTGESPLSHLEGGFENPLNYVKHLREECQAGERKEIESHMAGIKRLGFTINKAAKRIASKH